MRSKMHYNLVKASNRRYLEELKNRGHEMKDLYDSINIMQETEWVINKPVLDVIETLIKKDVTLGKLPVNPQSMELPPKPIDIATRAAKNCAKLIDARSNLSRKVFIFLQS